MEVLKMEETRSRKGLELKKYGSEFVKAGNIILRQRGTPVKAGFKCRLWERTILYLQKQMDMFFSRKKDQTSIRLLAFLPTKTI